MNQFNPTTIPVTPKQDEKFVTSLLGDLLSPLTNKLVYKVDSAIDGAKSNAIDQLLGNQFRVNIVKETPDLYAVTSCPVIGSIQFLKGVYKTFDTQGGVVYEEWPKDFTLPYSTICTFSRSKIEAVTDLRGQQDSVIELFGFSSWKIEIRGFILRDGSDGEPGEDNYNQYIFPRFSSNAMRYFGNLPDAIRVAGGSFSTFRISRIYIKDISFQEIEGKPHVLAYRIDAISSNQFDINIKP